MLYIIIQPFVILAQFALGIVFFIPKFKDQLTELAEHDAGCSNATVVGQVMSNIYMHLHAIHFEAD